MIYTQLPYYEDNSLYDGLKWPYYGSNPPGGFTVYPDFGGPPEPIYVGQPRRQSQQNPMQGYNQYKQFSSMFGSQGQDVAGLGPEGMFSDYGSESGSAGLGTLGWILAAIAGQHIATNSNSRVIEGHQTGDVFSGDFATEPWFAWLSNQMGWEPTAGEKFDAAVSNSDWGTALKRTPGAVNYWLNPINSWLAAPAKKYLGDWAGWVVDPIGELLG